MRKAEARLSIQGGLVLLLAVGCVGAGEAPVVMEADSAGVRIITSDRPLEEWILHPEPELELGEVGTGGPTEFFRVATARFLPDGRLVVVNRGTEELRFFDSAGAFGGSMGRDGHGPEEFRGLSWVEVLGDSLLTYDGGNDRLSIRDLSGSFGRTFRLEWTSGILMPLALLEDGTILSASVRHMTELEEAGTQTDVGFISRHDLNGSTVGSVGRFPVGERVVHREGIHQTTIGLPLSANAAFSAWERGFCYVFGPRFQIECFGFDGTLKTIMRVDAGPRAVQPRDVDDTFRHELRRAREVGNTPREQALLRARPSMAFPDELPAFSDLRTDDRARVWVRKYELPGSEVIEWWVLEDGRWVGRLVMDPAFDLMDIDRERVLGVWRDDLGIERVRIYRFGPANLD